MIKHIIAILILTMVISPVFAAVEASPNTDSAVYSALKSPYKNMDVRSLGMGGVGSVATNSVQALWSNPAGLADKKMQISIPTVGITIYNPLAYLENGVLEDALNGIYDTDKISNVILDDVLTYGYGKIADLNAGVSFTVGGFGLGIAVQDSLLTYADTSASSSFSIIDQLNAEIRMGYGFRFNFSRNFSLDVGASVGFSYLAYNKAIDGSQLISIYRKINKGEDLTPTLQGINIMAGWTIPINVGVRFNLPFGFSLATAVNNINFGYNMRAFDGYEDVLNAPFGNDGLTEFKLNSDLAWDFGVAWNPDWSGLFKPTIEADVVDIWGLIKDGDYSARAFINHLKLGAELRGLWIFDVRGGLDSGYWTIGAGLDFYAIRVEAAYYWHEFGSVSGEKGIDGFTVQLNIGL